MKLLLDTHLLLWAAENSVQLPKSVSKLLNNFENELYFSAVSIWEISIKTGLKRSNLQVDPRALRRNLLDNDYNELPLTSEHAAYINILPPIHHDPFDRVLIAQSIVEGMTLLTKDPKVAEYPASIRFFE